MITVALVLYPNALASSISLAMEMLHAADQISRRQQRRPRAVALGDGVSELP